MKRAFILTDLGNGDSGKGATVHWLCSQTGAHTVVRTGGAQALRNVVTDSGLEFNFSQFGSGTLAGAKTHLSRNMLIEPHNFYQQGQELAALGISNPFDLVTIDENALVITPFCIYSSRLKEVSRGAARHGSTGFGVGETIRHSESHPEEAIRAKDLGSPSLWDKLYAIQRRKRRELELIIDQYPESVWVKEALPTLTDYKVIDEMVTIYNGVASLVQITDQSYLGQILSQDGSVVFEPSQGVLIDRWYGFHPHTTTTNPKPDAALSLIEEQQYDGQVTKIGLIRAYAIRHGTGPFVTEDEELTRLLPDKHNRFDSWQGGFRVGHLDSVALQYAINACGGPQAFDGLAVSCLDRLNDVPSWRICDSYSYTGGQKSDLDRYFSLREEEIIGIKIRENSRDAIHLAHQEQLGKMLRDCRANLSEIARSDEAYLSEIEERLRIPLCLASYGPTESGKKVFGSLEHSLRQP